MSTARYGLGIYTVRFNIQQFYVLPITLHLCVLCGSQNKQRLFPHTTVTDWCLKPRGSVFTARYGLGLYIQSGLTLNNSTFCPHTVCTCFAWISEQTPIISPYSSNWLVFISERKCVYCAVRTAIFIWSLGEFSYLWPPSDSGQFSHRSVTAED